MKNPRQSTNSIFLQPEKSLTHWMTSILIFSFVMMPFVHYHPTVQLMENGKTHLLPGKVDILSFGDDSATSGEQGIKKEVVDAPEVKHLFKSKRVKKLDFYPIQASFTALSNFQNATTLFQGNSSPVAKKNQYHFPSTVAPPVSLA